MSGLEGGDLESGASGSHVTSLPIPSGCRYFSASIPSNLAGTRDRGQISSPVMFLPTDLYAAWCCVKGLAVPDGEFALDA